MKLGTLTNNRLWMPVLAIALVVGLVSWDHRQMPSGNNQDQHPTDTLPKKKKVRTEKKVRDLDDVIEELEAVDMDREMAKVEEELSRALKEIDGEKIRLQVEQSLKEVDMNKIRQDIDKAMKELDWEKMKKDVEHTVAKIDWDKIKKELDEVKKIDFTKIEEEMKPGTYKFVFEKAGYKKVTKEKVVVKTDEAFQLNIEMIENSSYDLMPSPFHFSDF